MADNFRIIKKFKQRHFNPINLSSNTNSPLDNPALKASFDKVYSNFQYNQFNFIGDSNNSNMLDQLISIPELNHAIQASNGLS